MSKPREEDLKPILRKVAGIFGFMSESERTSIINLIDSKGPTGVLYNKGIDVGNESAVIDLVDTDGNDHSLIIKQMSENTWVILIDEVKYLVGGSFITPEEEYVSTIINFLKENL